MVVGVLIVNAVVGMWKKSVVDKVCAIIAVVAFLLSAILEVSPIWIVLGAGLLGLAAPIIKGAGAK
ncbi:hypothetical protein SDC9_124637 [bioreactor metagenome]|uniref:Chromate transport protein n=1 Tax=bioreactor metagenome TaxID=1076179 RepID=A0A645CKW3_9ZZZZ